MKAGLAFAFTVVLVATGAAVRAADAPLLAPILAPIFQDHAVLQRDRAVAVWGTAPANSDVVVNLGSANASAHADATGHWEASLPAMTAGGPYDLSVHAGQQTRTIHDVLVGDVFLCSGQSNMEFEVRKATNAETEIGNAANPRIRLLKITRVSAAAPRATVDGAWAVAGPDSVRDFSAVCYFFAREIQSTVDVPIGLIDSSWGGSIIEAWMSANALRGGGDYAMPLSVLADYAQSPGRARAQWRTTMDAWWQAHDPATRAAKPWSATDFDDSQWATMPVAGWWEGSGIPSLKFFDGIIWLRAAVNLTAAQARQHATLSLGPIDDTDHTYVNGTLVGGYEGWDTPREYVLPDGVLHEGANVIAVGVLDTGGGGGLWGKPEQKQLRFADGTSVALPSVWRYRIAGMLGDTGAPPHAPWGDASGLTTLYNGMIAPLMPYGLRGVLWYQGEANVGAADQYMRLLPAMMTDWRGGFRDAEMPFFIAQLANFGPFAFKPVDSAWAALRDAQRRVVAADAHAALGVTIDIGDPYDIHPTQKQQVAFRLAQAARRIIYGDRTVVLHPSPLSAARHGKQIAITFAEAGSGLAAHSGKPLSFEMCDAARHCTYADAQAAGTRVILTSATGKAAFVRYCWADSPVCNLYNSENLPATPFEIPVK